MSIRNSQLTNSIRNIIPHTLVNTLRHLPNAWLAANYYQYPSKKLTTIGVTGSNGKTTTVTGIYHLLQTAKLKSGMISTIKAIISKQEIDTGFHTTSPDPWSLQKMLQNMISQNLTHTVIEATSHGLIQHRLYGINFDIGVITNITHEHLDYHATYDKYLLAKAKILNHINTAILNYDDQSYQTLVNYLQEHNPSAQIINFSTKSKLANLLATQIEQTADESKYICIPNISNHPNLPKQFTITLPLIGNYNISNSLAVIATGLALRLKIKTIKRAIKTYPTIPGRMEKITWKKRQIFIDFAHTPDGLEKALTALQKLKTKKTKLISIFGCAGLRDHQKRPIMGKISGKLADITILTAEDPRTEDVNQIIKQISEGCTDTNAQEITLTKLTKAKTNNKKYFLRIPDREQAIQAAIQTSKPDDIIGIFGKGHEQSMCYGTKEFPWSDQKMVKKYIN